VYYGSEAKSISRRLGEIVSWVYLHWVALKASYARLSDGHLPCTMEQFDIACVFDNQFRMSNLLLNILWSDCLTR
jgi:hypothetical protein